MITKMETASVARSAIGSFGRKCDASNAISASR
jgi:hypothetical protein